MPDCVTTPVKNHDSILFKAGSNTRHNVDHASQEKGHETEKKLEHIKLFKRRLTADHPRDFLL
jgi:hypothetical protein